MSLTDAQREMAQAWGELCLAWRQACEWEGLDPQRAVYSDLSAHNPYASAVIEAYEEWQSARRRVRAALGSE